MTSPDYLQGMEAAAKIMDGSANLYKAYAENWEKRDPEKSAEMWQHYRTCWELAMRIRSAKEAQSPETRGEA